MLGALTYARILLREPLFAHVHAAERAIPRLRAVPVGSTAREEPELAGECQETRDLIDGVTRMSHLHRIEPERRELLEGGARRRATGMRVDRETAGIVDEARRFLEGDGSLLDARRLPAAQPPVEGISKIGNSLTGSPY